MIDYVSASADELNRDIARKLGIAPPPGAAAAFAAQIANETAHGDPSTRGVRNNNPLNLTDAGGSITWPGQVGEDEAFAVFSSRAAGIDAAAQNYLASSYAGVIAAYRTGDPVAIAKAIEASPWDAGHYGGHSLEAALGSTPVIAATPAPALAAAAPAPAPATTLAFPIPHPDPAMFGTTITGAVGSVAGGVARNAALSVAPKVLIAGAVLFAILVLADA